MKCWKRSTTFRLIINILCEDQLDVCRSKSVPNLVITNWCYFGRANIWKNVTSKKISHANLNVLLNVNEVIYFAYSSSHTCFTTWSISPWRLQCCQTSPLVHILTQLSFVIRRERQRQAHIDNYKKLKQIMMHTKAYHLKLLHHYDFLMWVHNCIHV